MLREGGYAWQARIEGLVECLSQERGRTQTALGSYDDACGVPD